MLSFSRSNLDKPDENIPSPSPRRKPVIGIALGAGAARGWCHIGLLRELAANGIVPDVIAGTSIGAVVGGSYAAGRLDELEAFALKLTKRRVFGLMDISLSGGGLITGTRLRAQLEDALGDHRVEDLPIRFATVATEIGSGHEVWLTRGSLGEAIRASYALPGIFEPVRIEGRWLIDGALVNPVPVTICRALGADVVIAVNIISDTLFRGTVVNGHQAADPGPRDLQQPIELAAEKVLTARRRLALFGRRRDGAPGIASVMVDAYNVMQDRISRSRLAGDPPDVLIKARLEAIGLFDFHRAQDLISLGRDAARRALPDIAEHLALTPAATQPAI